MCVIIIKQQGRDLPQEVAKKSARINPDGLGVVWLDNYEVTYHKSKDYKVLFTDRPFIAHFRYATVGKVGKSNTHPFVCGKQHHEYLMMNGHICGLGNTQDCDSKLLARALGEIGRHRWSDELSKYACRFVTVNTRNRTFQMYNKHLWTKHDGIWYSKTNVIETNLIAVYGTLKKGNGNYKHYLSDSTFVGHGKTKDKYPLLIEGLPYLVNDKGFGHNVKVDVFRVSDGVLANLDRLEGHPNWYRRERIDIIVKDKTYSCWVYLTNRPHHGKVLHESYDYKPTYSTFGYNKPSVPSTPARVYDDWFFDSDWDKHERSASFQKELELEFNWDVSSKTPKKEDKPACVLCFDELDSDAYGNHYCYTCEEWFTDNQVIHNI